MSITLGAVADDFTGATDLANNLVRAGMRCVQLIGVPNGDIDVKDADAVVIALKSRSCSIDEAISGSLAAINWLMEQGACQLYFKYCSTFDSTDQGNIGPVADALLDRLGADQTVMVPAFPANGRTVYQGHLFVGDRLLNDSGMQHHPLTPMLDADLARVLGRQTPHHVGLLSHNSLSQGNLEAKSRLEEMACAGVRHVICDTLYDEDFDTLAKAVVDFPLVTGGSGLAQALPEQYRQQGWLEDVAQPGRLSPPSGSALVLSGSCSQTTLKQVEHFLAQYPGFSLDPLELADGEAHFQAALSFVRQHLKTDKPVMVFASADPERVKLAQLSLGVAEAGELVEHALGRLASILVEEGVGRLVVAGGESSGAVVSALGVRQLRNR